MPVNRITTLLRSIADYRVEACFLAALVFTLGHNAFHNGPIEIRTTTTHETVVHEVAAVRVAAGRRVSHAGHPQTVGIAVPALRPSAEGSGNARKIVMKRGSDAVNPCAGSSALAASGVAEGATCKVIRFAPVAPRVVVARTLASGG